MPLVSQRLGQSPKVEARLPMVGPCCPLVWAELAPLRVQALTSSESLPVAMVGCCYADPSCPLQQRLHSNSPHLAELCLALQRLFEVLVERG